MIDKVNSENDQVKNLIAKDRMVSAAPPDLGQRQVQCNVCGFVAVGEVGLMCQSPTVQKNYEAVPRPRCFGRMFMQPLVIDADWRCRPDTEEQELFVDRCIADAIRSGELQLDKPPISDVSGNEAALDKWLPIESAPKDGTDFLGWNAGWNTPHEMHWMSLHRAWSYGSILLPTHWIPLPAPPTRGISQRSGAGGDTQAALIKALEDITNSPHCSYDNGTHMGSSDLSYSTGVADGHRCAAQVARAALALARGETK